MVETASRLVFPFVCLLVRNNGQAGFSVHIHVTSSSSVSPLFAENGSASDVPLVESALRYVPFGSIDWISAITRCPATRSRKLVGQLLRRRGGAQRNICGCLQAAGNVRRDHVWFLW